SCEIFLQDRKQEVTNAVKKDGAVRWELLHPEEPRLLKFFGKVLRSSWWASPQLPPLLKESFLKPQPLGVVVIFWSLTMLPLVGAVAAGHNSLGKSFSCRLLKTKVSAALLYLDSVKVA
uniref:Uncharacterized protein n=1 Tax=Oryzias latipes TaxID=8090 RepID=A0A3B3HQF1_ORYLA